MQGREVGVQHAELPDIVICLPCREASRIAAPQAQGVGSQSIEEMQAILEQHCAFANGVLGSGLGAKRLHSAGYRLVKTTTGATK